ncbi:MAG: hypothetical protein V3U52_07610 [Thermoplasmata archaeon]
MGETQVPLIPRSLFFESELYHRLNQTDNLDAGPILENAKVVWRDMGEDTEDGIHAVINVGSVDDLDWSALVSMTRKDPDGNTIATSLDVIPYFPLLGIPWSALAALPYEPLPHSTSASYTWSSGGSTQPSIWEALWAGTQEILAVTLQYVASALAFYVDFFQVVDESLVQLGLWVSARVSEAPSAVKGMVEAAGEAFGKLVDWAFDFIVESIMNVVDPILTLAEEALEREAGPAKQYASENEEKLLAGDPSTALTLADIIYSGNLFNLVLAITIGIQVAWLTVIAATGGLGFVAAKAFDIVIGLVIGALIGFVATPAFDALLLGVDAFILTVVPEYDPFWAEGIGIALMGAFVALGRYFALKATDVLLSKTDAYWVAWALIGLILQAASGLLPDSMALS